MHTKRTVAARWFAVATVVWLTLLTVAQPASAHVAALATEPASGSTVETAPPRLLVRFGGPIEISLGSLRLVNSDGKNVTIGVPEHPGGEQDAVASTLSNVADGGYVAIYQVVAPDGHLTRGAFTFQVGQTSAPVSTSLLSTLATTSNEGGLSLVTSVVRVLMYAGLLVTVGGVLFVRSCWPEGVDDVRVRRLVRGAAIVGVVASLALIGLAAAQAAGNGLAGFTSVDAWRTVLKSHAGRWWIVRTLGIVLLGVVTLRLRRIDRRAEMVGFTVGAFVAFLGVSKGGHGTTGRWPTVGVITTMVHLTAASAWIGGLLLALLALRHGIDSIKRFSPIALVSVIGVVGSGVVQSARQLRTWSGWDGDYGHALRSKLIVVAVLITIGWLSRRLLRRPTEDPTSIKLRDTVGMEVLFAAGVLALTASLIVAPPPGPAAPKPFNTTLLVGTRTLDLIVEPAGQGVNTVHVTVQNVDGSIKNPTALTVRLSNPKKNIPAFSVQPTQKLANHASFEGVVIPVTGTWTLEVLAVYSGETVRFSTPVTIR